MSNRTLFSRLNCSMENFLVQHFPPNVSGPTPLGRGLVHTYTMGSCHGRQICCSSVDCRHRGHCLAIVDSSNTEASSGRALFQSGHLSPRTLHQKTTNIRSIEASTAWTANKRRPGVCRLWGGSPTINRSHSLRRTLRRK